MAIGYQQTSDKRISFSTPLRPAIETSARRRRFTFKRLALLALLASIISVGTAGYTALRTPGWYVPPVINDAGAQQRVRNNLINAEQAFTQSLLAGQPFIYHIYQDDLNRWIAMRKEIYAQVDELLPPVVADPFILIDEDRIVLAGRVNRSGVDAILSLELESVYHDDCIVLTARSLKCGSMPVPLDSAKLGLNEKVASDPGEAWPGSPIINGSLGEGLKIGSRATWKNGGVDYRVTGMTAHPGRLDLSIEPVLRQVNRRSDHWLDDDAD